METAEKGHNNTAINNQVEGTTYIVTEDLSVLIPDWCETLHKPGPSKEFFRNEIMEDLRKTLQNNCFAESDILVYPLDMDSLSDILRRPDSAHGKEYWICLDEVFPKHCGAGAYDFCLSVSRVIDEDGNDLGRTARSESPYDSLDEQISKCAQHYRTTVRNDKCPVVLVDDGTFDGNTVVTVLDGLAREGVFVETVKLGVAKQKGIRNIVSWRHVFSKREKAQAHQVRFLGCSKLCPPIFDWICERDFFPGVPFGGRALGELKGARLVPVRLQPGNKSVRQAYLDGWGCPREWAGLKKGIKKFTREALGVSIKLWEHLENLWSEQILVGILPSLPHLLYSSDAGKLEQNLRRRWLEVLQEERERIPG